jgi:hypothetical protein
MLDVEVKDILIKKLNIITFVILKSVLVTWVLFLFILK